MKYRHFDLSGTPWPQGPEWAERKRRLTAHLIARLVEYEEDGLVLCSPPDPRQQPGYAQVRLGSLDAAQVLRRLEAEYGILAEPGPGDSVQFTLGPDTRFEEIDRLHGAVGELLGA